LTPSGSNLPFDIGALPLSEANETSADNGRQNEFGLVVLNFDPPTRRPRRIAQMRAYLVAIALLFFGPSAFAQPVSQPSTANPELLSMDQKVIVGSIITEKTPPLTNTQFSPVVNQAVPSQIQIQILPPRRSNWRHNYMGMVVSSSKN
jgi:hypothetical protein